MRRPPASQPRPERRRPRCAERPGDRATIARYLHHAWQEVLLDNAAATIGRTPWSASPPIVLSTKAAEALGYRPVGTYAETVRETVDWLLEATRNPDYAWSRPSPDDRYFAPPPQLRRRRRVPQVDLPQRNAGEAYRVRLHLGVRAVDTTDALDERTVSARTASKNRGRHRKRIVKRRSVFECCAALTCNFCPVTIDLRNQRVNVRHVEYDCSKLADIKGQMVGGAG